MIGQYLLNKNENVTVTKFEIFSKLNKTLIYMAGVLYAHGRGSHPRGAMGRVAQLPVVSLHIPRPPISFSPSLPPVAEYAASARDMPRSSEQSCLKLLVQGAACAL